MSAPLRRAEDDPVSGAHFTIPRFYDMMNNTNERPRGQGYMTQAEPAACRHIPRGKEQGERLYV